MQREGKYPLPPQASKTIMGVEFSGIVTKLGKSASKFKEGDEVFGLAYGVCLFLLLPNRSRSYMYDDADEKGGIRRVHSRSRGNGSGQTQGIELGRGCCFTRELDDWYVRFFSMVPM